MEHLKQQTIRSGAAKLCGKTVEFVIRAASIVIMARLLDPKDFGLVAMVTAVTGLYGLFVTAGLSEATVQAAEVNEDQLSLLFWINIAVGVVLALACALSAPVLVRFYHEPRLYYITMALAFGFVVNAAAVQHRAIMQRRMQFVALAVVETISQAGGLVVGLAMAIAGLGYWAIIGSTLALPAIQTLCVWLATRWIPRLPSRKVEIRSMLRFGGTLTLNTLVVYFAYNFEKILIGRFWGPELLGLYGRAYQLVNVPSDSLNSAVGGVAFSALSRLQNEPARLKNYFLKGYILVNSLTIPLSIFSAIFAGDIITGCFGSKWIEATPIFRLLTPTVMTLGIINPMLWLLLSLGLYGRSFRIGLVLSPLVIASYAIGLPFGPTGVAAAYSTAMVLWLVPHIFWCVHGTPISPKDIFSAISKPLLSAIVAGCISLAVQYYTPQSPSAFLRIALSGAVFVPTYLFLLMFVAGQASLYLELFQGLRLSPSANGK